MKQRRLHAVHTPRRGSVHSASRTLVVKGNAARRSVPTSVDWAWLSARTSFRAQ